ncbi:hypothetical protein [Carboxylicivirga taeanensis]|uniref:hypothetical protein n=1 Tax=Carboxylicivirga taeanensis TaxID=1416875 RepID=UPI003F6DB740
MHRRKKISNSKKAAKRIFAGHLFPFLEDWCFRYRHILIWGIGGLFTVLSLLLFNLRLSEGGDDSTYIIRAVDFINDGTYPSFQGPLYPMFLSILVALFGVKLWVLKSSSLLLMLSGIYVFYRIFRQRISWLLLFSTLIISSLSSFYIYFTSQTYSEALFILIQLPVFALVFSVVEGERSQLMWRNLCMLSLVIIAGYLTRTVGLGALIAVVLYLALNKRYKELGVVVTGCLLLLGAFLLIKGSFWQSTGLDTAQANTLVYKHPYQIDKGRETVTGFVSRFIGNSNLYLSKHFMQMVGLKAADVRSTSWIVTGGLYFLFVFASFRAFKKNRYILFTAIYVATMLGVTFFVLQTLWDQYRLIVPFFSLLLLVLLYGLFQLVETGKGSRFQLAAIGLVIICSGSVLEHSLSKVDVLTLRKNLKGDLYEGYTDDWRNYLSMAEYVGQNLPKDTYAAARKPNMARIYANGKKFYGIYRYDTVDPDALLNKLKDRGVTHVIMASLRKNPAFNSGQTINTIQRYLYIISKKYPHVFKLEHKIGHTEPAYLFRVDYDAAVNHE